MRGIITSTEEIGKAGPRRYNGLEDLDDLEASILAGGAGRRMSALTAHLAKPLMYLPGGTLLEHQLALLARFEVSRIFVVTRYKGQQIRRAVGGLRDVTTLRQGPPDTLLSAIGVALRSAREPCILIHGDNYFSHNLDYLADAVSTHFLDSGCHALFAVDSNLTGQGSPEALAATGCYVLSPELLPLVDHLKESDQLCALTRELLEKGQTVGELSLPGWRQNVNEPGDLLATARRILEDWPGAFHCPGAETGYDPQGRSFGSEGPVWVSPQAVVVDCALGPFAVIGLGAVVRNSVLRNVIVFPGAEVTDQELAGAIVLPGPRGCRVLSANGNVEPGGEGRYQEEISQF